MSRIHSRFRWLTALTLAPAAGCNEFFISDSDTVVVDPIVVEESFSQTALEKVDILWVIDNTSSMSGEQDALAEAFGALASGLDEVELAWQLGVTSTDITDERTAGLLNGDPWILTPQTDDLATALAQAANVGVDGSAPEAGLGAAWLALTDPMKSDGNRGFRRDDAALHVVVVSDDDDDSGVVLGDDPAGLFLDFLDGEAERTGKRASLSAVIGDTPSGCTGASGAALPGYVYAEVASGSGGTVGSICDADLSPIALQLAEASAVWQTVFPLQADPVPSTVRVEVDGERAEEGWTLLDLPAAIEFAEPPTPGAQIVVRYEVLD